MEDIIIEEKQSTILRLNLLGLLMTSICAIILLYGIKSSSFFNKMLGGLGVLFFGGCTLYIFSRTIKPKALLTIKVDGFIDSSTAGSIGFISFSDIEKFEVVNIFGQRMIGVWPKDIKQFVQNLPQLRQKSARSSLRMNLPPVAIRVDTARDMSIEDILTLLQKRHVDYNGLYR